MDALQWFAIHRVWTGNWLRVAHCPLLILNLALLVLMSLLFIFRSDSMDHAACQTVPPKSFDSLILIIHKHLQLPNTGLRMAEGVVRSQCQGRLLTLTLPFVRSTYVVVVLLWSPTHAPAAEHCFKGKNELQLIVSTDLSFLAIAKLASSSRVRTSEADTRMAQSGHWSGPCGKGSSSPSYRCSKLCSRSSSSFVHEIFSSDSLFDTSD